MVVLKALSSSGHLFVQEIKDSLLQETQAQFVGSLRFLDPLLMLNLWDILATTLNIPPESESILESTYQSQPQSRSQAHPQFTLSQRQWTLLINVIYAGRAYELSLPHARTLVLHWLYDPQRPQLSPKLTALLVLKVLQDRRWSEILIYFGLESTSVIMKALSVALQTLIEAYAPQEILQRTLRFPRAQTPIHLDPFFAKQ